MTKKNKKSIIIFGFSGSGKSIIANRIAEKYGFRVIHPSGILRNLCEGKTVDVNNTDYNKGFWESRKGVKLFKDRLKKQKPLDIISDKIILQDINKLDAVIDSWSLPWLTNKGIKIYLKADINTRARRVAKRDGMSYSKICKIISMKDDETCKLFKRIYSFDIKKDHDVFDLIINTNNLDEKQVFRVIISYIQEVSKK